jgi:hypothetical protein
MLKIFRPRFLRARAGVQTKLRHARATGTKVILGTYSPCTRGGKTNVEDESDQPASKGYIMYANSPMVWTPVALPAEISAAAHAPHNNNMRAEIEQAAMLFDVDVGL